MRTVSQPGVIVISQKTGDVEGKAVREPRTNLFVMATIYSDAGSGTVKVRNVSSHGALIEGGAIPPQGARVRLSRGSLIIMGEIVWCGDGQAGLRFESSISVAEWLPRGRSMPPQHRVGEIVQKAKASELVPTASADDYLTSQSSKLSAQELTWLSCAVESLAEDLASDPEVVKRHMLKLQTLNMAAQALRKLAAER